MFPFPQLLCSVLKFESCCNWKYLFTSTSGFMEGNPLNSTFSADKKKIQLSHVT